MKNFLSLKWNLKSFLFFLLFPLLNSAVQAATVDIATTDNSIKIIPATSSDGAILVPATVEKGISFNRFSKFNLAGTNLRIFNGGNGTNSAPGARLIVIQASTIHLSANIEIIGSPADILFITNSSSTNFVSCQQCGFKNVGRVTLSAAWFSLNGAGNSLPEYLVNTSNRIGVLKATNGGRITINGLDAPGLQSLELIAERIVTTGTINTNLRAIVHPQGGHIIHPNGNRVVGAGGVNLYLGQMSVGYDDLRIKDAISKFSEAQVTGTFRAATIGISSPDDIVIEASADFSTISDFVSTSVRPSSSSDAGSLYVPVEGVYIQGVNNSAASSVKHIRIKGQLSSDARISIKSIGDIHLSGRVLAKDFVGLAKGTTWNKGNIQATQVEIGANSFVNNGSIAAKWVAIETQQSIYNSFGGTIKSGDLILKSNTASVINGSRSLRQHYPDVPLPLLISPDLNSLTQGIYYDQKETGIEASNASAHLLANRISIQAKIFENINPYFITKPSSADWAAGIMVNNQKAKQVSIQAENLLEIKAETYGLNSSAILGLNQEGRFIVNAPKFSNERYRLEMETYVYNQLLLSPDASRKFDTANVGTTSKIIAYSPPGRLYSFGEFRFSNGNDTDNIKELFINDVSYFEVFADAHFHHAELRSIGLEVAQNYDNIDLHQIRNCLMYRTCDGENVITSAESETLLSIMGNVYGIDDTSPSMTDFVSDNIAVGPIKDRALIEAYLKPFVYQIDEYNLGVIVSHEIVGDILRGNRKVCAKGVSSGWGGGYPYHKCQDINFQVSLAELRAIDAKDRELGGTGFTPAQLEAASRQYVSLLTTKAAVWPEGASQYFRNVRSHITYAAFAVDKCNISIAYTQTNEFYGGQYGGSFSINEPYSNLVPIRSLKAFLPNIPDAKCMLLPNDPRVYTSAQQGVAARAYVASRTVDRNLWSTSFASYYQKASSKTNSVITFVSYSVSGMSATVNYIQTDSYSGFNYASFSGSETHNITKTLSLAELMSYLPQ